MSGLCLWGAELRRTLLERLSMVNWEFGIEGIKKGCHGGLFLLVFVGLLFGIHGIRSECWLDYRQFWCI